MRSVAKAAGMSHGNLSTWLKNDALSAERVIAITYAVDADPVDALVATGFLRADPRAPETPEDIQRRIQSDLDKLDRAWRNRLVHGIPTDPAYGNPDEYNLINFPTPTGIYTDDDDDEMPEDAVAYGKQEWGAPDGDNDY